MVDHVALRADSATVLARPVSAAGLFVLDIGRAAPTAAGIAGATAAGAAASLVDLDGVAGGAVEGAGFVTGKHAAYQGAADAAGLTPVMVLAVTDIEYVLLDWNGNVRWGTGPTRVLARFPKATSTIAVSGRGATRHITLEHGETQIQVQCNMGLLASGKKFRREVLASLGG